MKRNTAIHSIEQLKIPTFYLEIEIYHHCVNVKYHFQIVDTRDSDSSCKSFHVSRNLQEFARCGEDEGKKRRTRIRGEKERFHDEEISLAKCTHDAATRRIDEGKREREARQGKRAARGEKLPLEVVK